MQFSPVSLSGTRSLKEEKGKGSSRLSPRKKHKRLDAICEKEYSRNHRDLNEGVGEEGARSGGGEDDGEIRRSSRVRRAPDLLDVSHPPPKKRRKLGMNNAGSSSSGKKAHSSPDLESPDSWKSRLRSRGSGSSLRVKEETPKGKRKLFQEIDGESDEEEVHGNESGSERDKPKLGNYTVVKSKRPGRIKATNGPETEKLIDLDDTEEEEGGEESGVAVNSGNEIKSQLDNHLGESTESGEKLLELADDCVNADTAEAVGYSQDAECVEKAVELEVLDRGDQSDVLEIVAPSEGGSDFVEVKQTEKQVDCGQNPSNTTIVASPDHGVDGGNSHDKNDDEEVELDEQPRVEINGAKEEKPKYAPRDAHAKPRIKEGRRCGLCGGGIDGKPPKPLAHDTVESGNDVYSGSSGSEEPSYDIWDGFGDEAGWLGRLLGPINDRFGIAGTWVHQHCAVWSPEVYFAGLGCLKNVRAALCRGRSLKCTRCARPGATIGCRVDRCPRTYHLPCARAIGCIFDHRKFLIACTDHRHIFQPHGVQNLARIKKVRAKKMKLELRKHTNEASRKDIEAEEKWFENCGDDEEFLKRESKRLHRDLARIAPVYIGGKDSKEGKLFQGWESVAGLQDVIQCMKEVVILPLLYPEFFDNLGLTPPRGILLHGHPGTGKTLVVRALIGACARGDRRIAYFARKGADCLGKYVGDAERQLRLLFQVAEKSQPSIIFFDEIDGLAPCRSRRQDQTHSSVVSTLLALMDGLKSRGSVIVIGATNRPDAIDPALRRPGRFDREIYFPLPSLNDRAAILSLHTQRWPKPVSGSLLQWIAGKTAGFAGADLQALCTQAAVTGLQRNFPLQETLSAAEKRGSSIKLLPLPNFAVEERDWLEALSRSPPPCSQREAGIAVNEVSSSSLPYYLIPCLLKPFVTLLISLHLEERISLPTPLSKAAATIKSVMVSTLEKRNLRSNEWWSFVEDFIRETDVAEAIGKNLLDSGFLIGDDSVTTNDFGDNRQTKFESCLKRNGETGGKHTSFSHRGKSGFRVLIAGSQGSGQKHLASCLVHCFVGNVEVQKIDLATISQEGHGDIVLGITQILMKCAGVSSCMLYMPRLDLWAVETPQQFVGEIDFVSNADKVPRKGKSDIGEDHLLAERENTYGKQKCKPEEKAEERELTHRISAAWSLFLEQVESISVSTSLTILATSEIPYPTLPAEVRQFFKKKISTFQPNLVEHTIPRFLVQVDEDFDHDLVVDLSLAKLTRDVVRQLIQMIHHRSHTDKKSSKYTTSDFVVECNEESVVKNVVKPNDRKGKGRSNLHLAISSLGYQILRYPHFAELCWFTSKLKEGPIAEITGPWRGWPFNSCVIRPQENGNFKSKEKPGLVRGLIAVGLSAYKGVYTSLREVSLEIRKVLELLVMQINEKVQSGKDRYQYVRLLSQVAYLEDKVDSWVFTLQSLELDASVMVDNFNLTASHDAPSKHSNVSELLEENRQGLVDENVECADLNKEDGDCSCPNPEVIASAYDGSLRRVNNFIPEIPVDITEGSEQVVGNNFNEQNGSHHEGSVPEDNGNNPLMDKDSGILEHPNESVPTDSAAIAESGCDLGEFGDNKCSSNGSVSTMNVKDGNYPSSEATQTVNLCLYRCCSECLKTLHDTVRKILVHQRGWGKNLLTVDDVHTIVMSLSVDLVTSVRRVYDSGNLGIPSGGETSRGENGIRSCRCCDSGNRICLPIECSCHSNSAHEIRESDSFRHHSHIAAATNFVFRDGVLIGHNPCEDATFHCRFETLCLCAVIETIRCTDRPSS